MVKFNDNKNNEFDRVQKWYSITKGYTVSETKPSGWIVEMQYVFKSKKKALQFFDKIDKEITKEIDTTNRSKRDA